MIDQLVRHLNEGYVFPQKAKEVEAVRRRQRAGEYDRLPGARAHPVEFRRLTDRFGFALPTGRAINPVSGTNWEGTGVRPDVAVPAAHALETAYVAALRDLIAATPDPARRRQLEEILAERQRKLDALRSAPGGG